VNDLPFLYIPADEPFETMCWIWVRIAHRYPRRPGEIHLRTLHRYRRASKADGRRREKRHVRREI
jgi:hypothetical protein